MCAHSVEISIFGDILKPNPKVLPLLPRKVHLQMVQLGLQTFDPNFQQDIQVPHELVYLGCTFFRKHLNQTIMTSGSIR